MKNKLNNLSKYHLTFETGLLIASLILLIMSFTIPLFLPFVLFGINTLFMFILKQNNDIYYNKIFLLYRINIILYILLIIKYLGQHLETALNISIPIYVTAFIFTGIIICFATLLFVDNEKKKNFVRIIPQITSNTNSGDESDYDIIICKNKYTGEDVVLSEEDRFLHTFIDGPTGSGKTTQFLLPMIYQDIVNGHGITVIEPKGDLAIQCYALCKLNNRDDFVFFNPINPDCPKFNVLDGKEEIVIETIVTTFLLLSPDSKTYYKDLADVLLRNAVMVAKRLEDAYMDANTGISSKPATLLVLSDLLNNPDGRGADLVKEFNKIPTIDKSVDKQNKDIVAYFINEYYRQKSIIFQNTSGVRNQINKLVQNKYLRKVLNPVNGKSEIDFSDAFENKKIVIISTEQGILGNLSSYLGSFIMYNLQSAVMRRPGDEETRVPHIMYIDEAQNFLNAGFSKLLEQGRSYRIAIVLGTQARTELGDGTANDKFLESVSANTRNNIVLPGISPKDRDYYEKLFGEHEVVKTRRGETTPKYSFFAGTGNGSENISYEDTKEARYSKTDLAYKEFSEATYQIVKHKTLQHADDGVARFLPRELSDQIKEIRRQYMDDLTEKQSQMDKEEYNKKTQIYKNFQTNKSTDDTTNENTNDKKNLMFNYDKNKGKILTLKDKEKLKNNNVYETTDDFLKEYEDDCSIPVSSGVNPLNNVIDE